MDAKSEQLVVDLIARVSQFERDIKRAEGTGTRSFTALRRESMTATKAMEADFTRSAGRINQAMQSTQSAAGGLTRSLGMMMRAGPLAGVASVGGGLAALNAIKTELLALEALSKRTGMTVNQVNGMNLLGARNGISAQVMSQGLQGVADKLAEAARGEGELGKLFELNNLKLKDRAGQVIGTNEALGHAARLIQNAANESDKIKIAELLGLTKEWVPILERGAAAFRKAQEDATAAAGTIDRELIRKAGEFDKVWNETWANWNAWGKSKILDVGRELSRLWTMASNMSWGPGPGVPRDSDLRPGETRGQPRGSLRDPSTDAYVAELTRQQAIRSGAPLTGGVTRLPTSGGGGGGGGARETDTAKSRLDKYIDSLARQDAVLQAQIATFGKSNAVQRAAEEIARAQVDLNRLDATTRAEVVKRLTDQVNSSEGLRTKLEELNKAQERQRELQDANKEFFGSIFKGAATGKLGIDTLTSALNRLQDRMLTMAFDQFWESMFPKNGQASGGGLGSMFQSLLSTFFGGFRAEGGPVAANRAYIVGERGPELFLPKAGGHIIPNAGIARPPTPSFGGGGMRPQVNVKIQNNYASGATATVAQDRDGNLMVLVEQVKSQTKGEIAQEITDRRGGIGGAIGSSFGIQQNGGLIG